MYVAGLKINLRPATYKQYHHKQARWQIGEQVKYNRQFKLEAIRLSGEPVTFTLEAILLDDAATQHAPG